MNSDIDDVWEKIELPIEATKDGMKTLFHSCLQLEAYIMALEITLLPLVSELKEIPQNELYEKVKLKSESFFLELSSKYLSR